MKKICFLIIVFVSFSFRLFDNLYQVPPTTQIWTNPGLITTNDDWSGVPGIQGFLGQNITVATGTDR